ncbi:MAG: metal ABC transporter permease [Chloroflexota bacterium]
MLEWFSDPFSLSFTQNALKELALISILSGVVGTFVVLRGIAFIVDGLSHAILPGVAIALLVDGNRFVGAFCAALVVTALISLTSRSSRVSEDSAIGIFFTGAFSLGIILITVALSGKSRKGSSVDILFGQLFGVTEQDLSSTLLVGSLVVLVFGALHKELLLSSFDPTMAKAMGFSGIALDLVVYLGVALTVVIALPAVGNVLVLSFLITPAATARLLTDRLYWMMGISIVIALLSSVTGLYLSYYLSLAGGATVVTVTTLFFLMALLLAPRYGLIARYVGNRSARKAGPEPQEGAGA